MSAERKPNILVIWGDDIGITNLSCYSDGLMGYRTPNIDRIGEEGVRFTDFYGEQSCTAGRAAFICGQNPYRTGLTKVGMPGADLGLQPGDPTIATALKARGYTTGQFGKNHLGDKDEFLPTNHGFDEFFGNLYHLNAEEEPELADYPSPEEFPDFRRRFGPRGVLHSWADGRIEDTGPLTKKRMETIDDEVTVEALRFIGEAKDSETPFFVWFNTTHMHFRTHGKPESRGQAGRKLCTQPARLRTRSSAPSRPRPCGNRRPRSPLRIQEFSSRRSAGGHPGRTGRRISARPSPLNS